VQKKCGIMVAISKDKIRQDAKDVSILVKRYERWILLKQKLIL